MSRSQRLSDELLESNHSEGKISLEQFLENVEQTIDELTEKDYHYSLDVLESGAYSVRLGVYGVKGFEKPSRQTAAEAVSQEFGWETAYEDGESTHSHYDVRVLKWDE